MNNMQLSKRFSLIKLHDPELRIFNVSLWYLQIASAIKEIVRQAGSDTNPHFICGDFNNKPSQAGYQLAKDGYLSDDMILSLQADESVEMPDGPVSGNRFDVLDNMDMPR